MRSFISILIFLLYVAISKKLFPIIIFQNAKLYAGQLKIADIIQKGRISIH